MMRTVDRSPGQGTSGSDGSGEQLPSRRRPRETTPAQRALGLLVRREHSRKELALKLQARGIDAADAAAAVATMVQAGWQDDTRFACSLARTRAAAGYGPLHIRAELVSHRLAESAISAAFAALTDAGEDDWSQRARAQVRRRFGVDGTLTLAQQRKAADYLMRRGFDGDCVRQALRPD
jgi:regulatory protein